MCCPWLPLAALAVLQYEEFKQNIYNPFKAPRPRFDFSTGFTTDKNFYRKDYCLDSFGGRAGDASQAFGLRACDDNIATQKARHLRGSLAGRRPLCSLQ